MDELTASLLRSAACAVVRRERSLSFRARARWSPSVACELLAAREALVAFERGLPSDGPAERAFRARCVAEARS